MKSIYYIIAKFKSSHSNLIFLIRVGTYSGDRKGDKRGT